MDAHTLPHNMTHKILVVGVHADVAQGVETMLREKGHVASGIGATEGAEYDVELAKQLGRENWDGVALAPGACSYQPTDSCVILSLQP